ncbi:hypothetical protein B0H19DRAFT_303814 [Mycena capillaripes]|nr:hypothetical protein B0H19DRAFT_303814 [Mycena capillaripes]
MAMAQSSRTSEAPPVKRQRLEDEDITRSDIWHDDGSVVLQAETTQFRVHWSILSLQSTFFREMRDLPQPADQPSIEGCPVIELHYSAADVKHLLHALYNQLIFSEKKLPFPFIAAIVRMGRKYEFKSLLEAAVQRLTHENPATLEEYERTTVLFNKRSHYSATQIEAYSGIMFDVLTLARENNLFALLPCAFFRAVFFYSPETIFNGIPQTNGPPVSLSSRDQQLCIIGSQKLIQAQWDPPRFFDWLRSNDCAPGCTNNAGCTACKRVMFLEIVKTNVCLIPFRLSGTTRLCSACALQRKEILDEAKKSLWEKLPSFFDLPPWGELKNDP